MSETLIIIAKTPKPGFCKTRLCPPLTPLQACAVHCACLLDLTEKIKEISTIIYRTASEDDFWDTVCKYGQTTVSETVRKIPIKTQVGEDLGQRIQQALSDELSIADKAILIGTDCPQISNCLLQQAFELLNEADLLLGPAADGGYYLIGLKKAQAQLFTNISWGSEKVLKQTLKKAEQQKLKTLLLPQLTDIDTWEDIKRLQAVDSVWAKKGQLSMLLKALLADDALRAAHR